MAERGGRGRLGDLETWRLGDWETGREREREREGERGRVGERGREREREGEGGREREREGERGREREREGERGKGRGGGRRRGRERGRARRVSGSGAQMLACARIILSCKVLLAGSRTLAAKCVALLLRWAPSVRVLGLHAHKAQSGGQVASIGLCLHGPRPKFSLC